MVISMHRNCPKGDVGRVIAVLREFDLEPRLISPDSPVVLGVVEEISPKLADRIKTAVGALPGVEEITDFVQSWRLVSRSFRPQPTVVEFGGRRVGDDQVLVVAGPCAVESRKLLLETASALAEAGAGALRGGAFKPRTSPYSFRGLGEEGLRILAEARDQTGLPVITEVLSPQEVDLVAAYADVLQVGARNMQNFALLEAVGGKDRPVLLKRGLMASVKELLLSAEYILAQGNWQVMLCERGIRTFETETRNTLDLSVVPLLKQYTHLPVIVDPSHAAGKRELVPALARAAVAAGADGIMVEVHPRPKEALSDGRQSLTLPEFEAMMSDLSPVARAVGCLIPGVAS
jgi:3-deoxy-7-phosphoheptulonate synthase